MRPNQDGSYVEHGYTLYDEGDGNTLVLVWDSKGSGTMVGGKYMFKGGGIWHVQSGTGRYANGQGEGTFKYEGSPAQSIADWTGTFTPAGQ